MFQISQLLRRRSVCYLYTDSFSLYFSISLSRYLCLSLSLSPICKLEEVKTEGNVRYAPNFTITPTEEFVLPFYRPSPSPALCLCLFLSLPLFSLFLSLFCIFFYKYFFFPRQNNFKTGIICFVYKHKSQCAG